MSEEITSVSKEEIEARSKRANVGSGKRQLLRNLRDGEDAMRAMSTGKPNSYLPLEPNETKEAFDIRVKHKTSLNNSTSKSVKDMVTSVFEKEILFETEDEDLKRIIENFNGAGEDLNSWAESWMMDASFNGAAYALVNFDKGTTKEDPYCIEIDAEDVHNIRKNKKGKMTLFKYEVNTTEPKSDFADIDVKYVYVYKVSETNIVTVTTYKGIYEEGVIENYNFESETTLAGWTEIPIVELYPETRSKNLDADCPYSDIALKNLVHWKNNSLYHSLVNTASRPFIFGSGFKQKSRNGKENKIPFGIKVMYTTEDPNAKISWVQADNNSSDMIIKLLDKLEMEMEVLGSEFISISGNSKMTATEVNTTSADTNARATKYSTQLEKALIRIVNFMLKWKKKESVEFDLMTNKNIGVTVDVEKYNAIMGMFAAGLISAEHCRMLLKAIDYLPQDWTEEEITLLLEKAEEDSLNSLIQTEDEAVKNETVEAITEV